MIEQSPSKAVHAELDIEPKSQVTQGQSLSPRFSSFLTRGTTLGSLIEETQIVNPVNPPTPREEGEVRKDPPLAEQVISTAEGGSHHVTVTKQEILALTNVLNRIPRSFLTGEGTSGGHVSLNVVNDPPISPTRPLAGSSRDTVTTSTGEETRLCSSGEEAVVLTGKRQRPKYSLKTSMLRKHPVLQFSATGPIDREMSPYKWWCRVCRVELSLMSRGVLELLSHYRTEGHLVKEHRIRLETPGAPLFDQHENELLGIALQEAKRIAKEMYPISPQLDSCKLLVGQERIPDLTSTTSPSESIIAQISVLEHGLRNGGHIDCFIGIWNEMATHTLGTSEARNFSWNHPRLFVSVVFFLFVPDV